MTTAAFWAATAERAVKTFAQALAALLGVEIAGILSVDWGAALASAGTAALLSVLTSLAGSGVGGPGPSFGQEILARRAGIDDAADDNIRGLRGKVLPPQ